MYFRKLRLDAENVSNDETSLGNARNGLFTSYLESSQNLMLRV